MGNQKKINQTGHQQSLLPQSVFITVWLELRKNAGLGLCLCHDARPETALWR